MAKVQVIGGFSAETAAQNAVERSINWYPEKIDGKETWRLRRTPGLRLFATLPEFPLRGGYETTGGRVFIAAGSGIYELSADGTYVNIGSLPASSGNVSMDDNGFQLIIVDGVSGWVYTFATSSYAQIVSDGFFPSPTVVVYDGYALMFRTDSGVYFYSNIYDGFTYNPTSEGSAESNPDNIQNIVWDGGGPVILGYKSVEYYYDSGDNNLVFKRRPGAQSRYGCIARWTALNVDDGVMWLGRDPNGQGSVYRVSGAQPSIQSSLYVDEAIRQCTGVANATATSYNQNGSAFYCLNLPGADTTYIKDLGTSYWHERRSFNADGTWGRWRVEKHTLGFGLNLGLDYENGNVYIIDPNYMKELETPIRRERIMTPLFDNVNNDFVNYGFFSVDITVGDVPPDETPNIVMYVSDDGGKTFGSGRSKDLGKIGEYDLQIKWNRCGRSRNRVFKIATLSAGDVGVYGAYAGIG